MAEPSIFETAMDLPSCLVMPGLRRKVIVVEGEEARAFLHALSTANIETLPDRQCRLAALCNPNGRVLATFLVWAIDGVFYLAILSELAETTQKTLLFYRLRSKVDIRIAPSRCFGVAGETADTFLTRQGIGPLPKPMGVIEQDDLILLNLDGRYLFVGDYFGALETAATAVNEVALGNADQWDRLDIVAGWPNIALATQGHFVAQQVNLDLLDAIDFEKGCFPGRGVIARLQLTKPKSRMVLCHQKTNRPPQPGEPVFRDEDRFGEIVSAQPSPESGVDMLVVLPLDGTGFDGLSTPTGGPLDGDLPLPYAIDGVPTDRSP